MLLSTLRIIRFGWQDLQRNFSLSIMTVLILVLMLLSVNTIIIIRMLTAQAVASVNNQIDLSIFFDHRATDKQIADVRAHARSFPEVTDMKYLTKEEVLAQFRARHQGNEKILSSLDTLGENPLGPTLIIKAREASDYEKIIASLNVPEYDQIIKAKTFADTQKTIARIHVVTTRVEQFSLSLSLLFAFIAFLIIFNTVRVAIYTQRTEISIKKLVGATNWFVRGPYLVEALIFSLVAAALSYGLVLVTVRVMDPYIAAVFQSSAFLTSYFESHILSLLGFQFGAVLLLTAFTSLLAMRRYLRV